MRQSIYYMFSHVFHTFKNLFYLSGESLGVPGGFLTGENSSSRGP
jgi:hypothetical protein